MKSHTTITINEAAFRVLKKLKRPGQTYSDAILNNIRPPAETGAEILEALKEFEGKKLFDDDLMAEVLAGRGRRPGKKDVHAA